MLNSTLASLVQVDDLAFGLRIAETGVVMDAAVGYLPDSALGKAVAAFKAAEPPLMDSLPGQQYVMAITTNAFASPEERDAAAKNIETLLDNPDAKIPAEQKGKIVKFYKSLHRRDRRRGVRDERLRRRRQGNHELRAGHQGEGLAEDQGPAGRGRGPGAGSDQDAGRRRCGRGGRQGHL